MLANQFTKLTSQLGHMVHFLQAARRHGKPEAVIFYGAGIGDDLMCTTILHEMKRRHQGPVWLMSRHAVLFEGNPDASQIIPESWWLFKHLHWFGVRGIDPHWANYNEEQDRDILVGDNSAFQVMCEAAGITGEIELRPWMWLTDEEKQAGKLADKQIVIHSTGMAARFAIPTKEWYPERFQAVVDGLGQKYNFIQLGMESDPLLEGCLDLRGKTNIRQSAAIVSQSQLLIGQVGFLMHIARAVDCRAVIVVGGREDPAIYSYTCFENICSPMECSPCWRGVYCPYDMECMKRISTSDVIEAAERQLTTQGPLHVDTAFIGSQDSTIPCVL